MRPLMFSLIVAGIPAAAQVFEGLDLSPSKPKKTSISVKLTPPLPGATLTVDDEAPVELPVAEKVLKPGPHTLKVEKPGYRTIEEKVTLVAGKKKDFAFTLEATGGAVTFEANIEGASVTVDGEGLETLPFTKVLAAGPHKVTVVAPGYKTEQRTLDVAAGADRTETFALVAGGDRPTAVNLEPPDSDSDLDAELDPKKKRAKAAAASGGPSWVLWVGIGLAVVGGAVAAVAITQAPKPTPEPSTVCGGPCDGTLNWPVTLR